MRLSNSRMMAHRDCSTGADTCVQLKSGQVSGKTSCAQRFQPCLFLVTSLLLLVISITNSRAADNIIAFTGVTLVDAVTATSQPDTVVIIRNGRISKLGADGQVAIPEGARVIVLRGKWLIPGLIDAHVHFFQSGGLYTRPDVIDLRHIRPYEREIATIRERLPDTLQRYLASGVTSVVDLAGPRWVYDLRALADGSRPSPRVMLSGPGLAAELPPGLDGRHAPALEVRTADEARAAVRKLATRRPDLIKIWFSPSRGMDLEREFHWVSAAIDEAHGLGLRVTAHATQHDIAGRMVRAGADILVHSIDDRVIGHDLLEAMRTNGVIYIPTLAVSRRYAEVLGQRLKLSPYERVMADPDVIATLDDMAWLYPGRRRPPPVMDHRTAKLNLLRVQQAGITIAAGSDAGNIGSLHGPGLHHELELMVDAGLGPAQVLLAATRGGAQVMGRSSELGRLEPGMLADLLVLDADPLVNIRNARRIALVVAGGRIVQCNTDSLTAVCPK